MRSLPMKPIIVTTIAVVGVAAFFVATSIHFNPVKASAATTSSLADVQNRAAAPAQPANSCVAPASVPAESLKGMQTRARQFADQKRFSDALPEFRGIAAVDPGFPGVNLDVSVSQLQLKHAPDAKQAIDAQLTLSDCLSKLAPEQLTAYCKAEMGHASPEECKQQLQAIQQNAYLQAAVVQMELDHPSVDARTSEASAPAADSTVTVHTRAPRSAVVATDTHKTAAPRAPREGGDKTLMMGAGTDADLGAYSKN